MLAAILDEGKLSVKEVPKPSPGYEEALVKLTTAGVCHSDLHLVKGEWGQFRRPGGIPVGHEGIGVVEELGPGAEKLVQKGDRVIMGLGGMGGGYWCGACEYCLSGRPRLCREARPLSGTYAEYISVWVKALVKLPDQVSDSEVSLACGGLTSYSAVKKLITFNVTPNKVVAIIGAAGGVGHYAVQIAKEFGYKVVGVDIGNERLEFVKALGADFVVDANEALQFVREKLGGVNASIVFTPKLAGFELGMGLLKRGGIFIAVGLPPISEGSISVMPFDMLNRDLLIMSSAVGTVQEMRELIQLAADGKVKTHISRTASLSEAAQVLEELDQGRYTGRAILKCQCTD
jgi:propanol-preferring alcohol dehydrogenase